ncbi:MAG TPA: ATP-binding protein, partial [Bacteroidota bacterium]|nr:ATP-binding protein [Bacteroidota bacterium]
EEEINLFRIVQESLNNILKHSHATELGVTLQKERDRVILRIEDNGCGFQQADGRQGNRGGLGLSSMAERARILGGEIRIESNNGRGTSVLLTLPLGGYKHG